MNNPKDQESLSSEQPLYYIHSQAPMRICDLGGWTDTWFAQYGQVLHMAVEPFAQVQAAVYPRQARLEQVEVFAENYCQRFGVQLGLPPSAYRQAPHPLLQATIACLGVPEHLSVEITIYSSMPGGASTGTSASVTVALAAALDNLQAGRMTPYELAMLAQKVETEWLGQQCGIQDQLCSAYGGIQLVEMRQYPHASLTPLELSTDFCLELEQRLSLVYLGATHKSTQVHEMVIAALEDAGPHASPLQRLRAIVPQGWEALLRGDFEAFGQAMIANHEAQRALHPALISSSAERVVEIAQAYGILGWKVNGAGGEGGSLTLLSGPRRDVQRAMLADILVENPDTRLIPIRLSTTGVQVWRTPGLW
jgi:D-glycero-alpha-D-manno-heptose-7-phosphate kinase